MVEIAGAGTPFAFGMVAAVFRAGSFDTIVNILTIIIALKGDFFGMTASDFDVAVVNSATPSQVEAVWRPLEQRAENSFFVSWHWIGAWMRAVKPDAALITAAREGVPVGAALIVRAPRTWRNPFRNQYRLHETGLARTDSLFVEYNSVLAHGEDAVGVLPAMLAALRRERDWSLAGGPELIISGAASNFAATLLQRHPDAKVIRRDRCYFVDLAKLRRKGGNFLGALSANTRQQLRRARRDFSALGEIQVERAETVDRAQEFLASLKPLHILRWRDKGKPSGFDNPAFEPMLNELLAEGVSPGAIDALHVRAGGNTLGYLINFNYRGRVMNYTSGFQYSTDKRLKPGLVCHLEAIERADAHGALVYDFLAGASQYKDSLSTDAGEICGIRLRF